MKIIFFLFIAILLTPIYVFILAIITSLFIKTPVQKHENTPFCRFLSQATVFFLFPILRTHIHTEGIECVPSCPFLLVSNHVSNFDPIVVLSVLRKRHIAFISKEKNMHIPFYGRIIQKCGFLSIDRSNPAAAMETIITASDLIRNQEIPFGVYPEGTRSADEKLGRFHAFVFRIAKLADCPVVVMTIRGTKDIARNFPLRGANVSVKFLQTLDVSFIRDNPPALISEKAYSIMEADLG